MQTEKFLDSHVHLWRANDRKAESLKAKIPILSNDYLLQDLKAATGEHEPQGYIIVQTCSHHTETFDLLEQSETEDAIVGVIGWLDMTETQPNLTQQLHSYQKYRKFRGIRVHRTDYGKANWLDLSVVRSGFAVMQSKKIPVDFLINCHEFSMLNDLAMRFSRLPIIVNHLGRPLTAAGDVTNWSNQVRELSTNQNVVCKLSGLIEQAGMEWSSQSLLPWVSEAIDVFGADRLLFASNWPVVNVLGTYQGWIETLFEIFEKLGLSQLDQKLIMSNNSTAVYGLENYNL